MRKFFTFAAVLLASMAMNAATIFGPFTLTAENNVKDQANAVEGGTATVTTVFPTGSSNEVTIDDWTFYKFNSSSAIKCELADNATFEAGDSIFVTLASHASSKKTCGVKLNNSITVSGEIPGGQYATFGYAVVAEDGIAGANFFTIYRSSSDSKFGRVLVTRGGATPPAPSTDSVATATISGADSCYVGKSVTLTCTAEHATTYQWYNTNGIIEGATAKTYVFTPDAEGTYGFYCLASNQYNTNPVRSNSLVVTATIKPAAVSCAIIIPATTGDSLKVGDEVDLDATSEGGKIFVAGMKTPKSSISYNALGLMLGGGGADSIRVEFNNLIAEGSVIKLVMAAGGTSERGLNLQTVAKSNQFQAKWTPAAVGEVREFEYTVPAGSKLIGDYRILLQRNNTVYLQSVSMADCGAARPGTTVISTVETLTGVTINDAALNATDFAELLSAKTIILGDSSYVDAPVVKFTKHVVITYEDQSTQEKDVVIAKTSQQSSGGTWGASATINGVSYSVYTVKTLSYNVKYYDGATFLGTEAVAVNGTAAKYTEYSVKPLCEFVNWYTDSALTQVVESWVVTADMNVYGKWTKLYASSLNIEQFVLDYGTKAKIKDTLNAHGWAYSNINDLDSLNDEKANRNEPYLGLKLKAKGASVGGWIHTGDTITVKFGNVGDSLIARINGEEMKFSKEYLANGTLGRRATADEYLELVTTTGSTVVLKQFMVNEGIQDVVLPGQTKYLVTCATAEHGTIKVNGKASAAYAPGDTVVVAVTPAKGYHVVSVTAGDAVLVPENDVYSFVMIAQDVTVSASFAQDAYMVDFDDDDLPVILGYHAEMFQDSLVIPGTVVTMTYEGLEAGYEFVRFFVYKTGDEATPVAMPTDSTFVMPAYDVTFSAVCKPIQPTLYRVVADSTSEGGSIGYEALPGGAQAAAGDTITLVNIPEKGYMFVSYVVYKLDDHSITVPVNDGKFIMPAHDVYVSGTFEAIPPTLYTVTVGTYEHGAVIITDLGNPDHKYAEGDEVHLAVEPAEGYELEDISLAGIDLALVVDADGNCSFNMPGQDVTVLATFKHIEEGIDDINASAPAVKRIMNGVLVIEKNGKLYTTQGAEIK